MIAIDTETCLIQPGVLAPPLVCLSWCDGPSKGLLHREQRGEIIALCKGAFEGETIFANAPFDLAVLMAYDLELVEPIFNALENDRVHDIQTRQKLLDLAEGCFRFKEDEDGNTKPVLYNLAALGVRHGVGGKVHDQWRLRYHELIDLPLDDWPKEALYYALRDAVITYRVWGCQQEDHYQVLREEPHQVRAHMALHFASCRGIKTDPERVKALREDTEARIAELKQGLVKEGLVRANGTRDVKKAVTRMCREAGPTDVTFTKTGHEILRGDPEQIEKLKKTKEAREFLQDRSVEAFWRLCRKAGRWVSVAADVVKGFDDQALKDYADYSRYNNLLSGSIKDFEKGVDYPIQTRFDIIKHTGRTGSSKPNIQNIRRYPGIRECFVPRDGYVFVAADYAIVELHCLAQSIYDLGLSKHYEEGKPWLMRALNKGLDPHLWMAARLLGTAYENALERYEQEDPEVEKARQLSKAANYGFPGGCSARTFAGIAQGQGLDVDARQAARLRSVWFSTWLEMEEFFRYVGDCKDDNGWHFARLPRTGFIRQRCTFTAACNCYFQGLAAAGAKRALWAVCRAQKTQPDSLLFGTHLVNFVHDEFLLEAPEDTAHEAAVELSKVMADAFNVLTPDCPVHADPVIMRYWSKKAKPVWEDGRLVPWEAA